ncbi:MAG: bifunctional adenosylcobinamide kinase/adenosylcobinamide-phosphate guanylyltransferase [Muribaculaceae bacterium]|nr:bifunctional adenosylcobinamide kinase/adenosylcobinamide-phosphate guanylyltransferase [Muribaculaceae bacterium]
MDKTPDQKKTKVIMVTGGQRSGKSLFAEQLTLSLAERPIYLATARVFDSDMQRRVDAHRQRRKQRWHNLESPLHISQHTFTSSDTVLLDCLTLLATNWFFEMDESIDAAYDEIKREIDGLMSTGATIIIVTNEVGLGGVSGNDMQRHFADLQGMLNQFVAAKAEEVYMIISGIPVKIK